MAKVALSPLGNKQVEQVILKKTYNISPAVSFEAARLPFSSPGAISPVSHIPGSCGGCCPPEGSKMPPKGHCLDTLAQLGTNPENEDFKLKPTTKRGERKPLLKRARRKYFSSAISLKLVDAANSNKASKLGKSYWNTWHCSRLVTEREDGQITARYCKNRFCPICCSIRSAQAINKYAEVIDSWDDKWFCTLTRRNVTREDLKATIDEMMVVFKTICERFKRRGQRGTGQRFVGFRKLECTYNVGTDRYHPHIHLIGCGEKVCREFVEAWKAHYRNQIYEGKPVVNDDAQDIRPADDNCCKEVFKYFSKLISTSKKDRLVYADALDHIFNAVSGRRVFQTVGFQLEKTEEEEEEETLLPEVASDYFVWNQVVCDWINYDTGELLTGYKPGDDFKEFVTCKIIVRCDYNSS